MPYTNNTPQGSDQIAITQPLIQANFGFLGTGLAVDHIFTAGGSGSDMHHKQAAMTNQADPATPPVGTNGMYYVNGGEAKFINSSNQISKLSEGNSANSGYQWVGQVRLQWGTTGTSNTNVTVNLSPTFNTINTIQVTRQHVGASPGSSFGYYVNPPPDGTKFTIVNIDGHSYAYSWLVIGT